MNKGMAIVILKKLKFDLSQALVDNITGKVEALDIAIKNLSKDLVTCPLCKGFGYVYLAREAECYGVKTTCYVCDGTGFIGLEEE